MGKAKITECMTISDVLRKHPGTTEVFFRHGLHCLGCAASQFENLGEAAEAHGIDTKKLLADLNAFLNKTRKFK